MESLNQHVRLYAAMKAVWSEPRLVSSFTAEQHRVADTFVREMEQHGISQNSPNYATQQLDASSQHDVALCSHRCSASLLCSLFTALPAVKREQAAALQGDILQLMTHFTANVNEHKPHLDLSLDQSMGGEPTADADVRDSLTHFGEPPQPRHSIDGATSLHYRCWFADRTEVERLRATAAAGLHSKWTVPRRQPPHPATVSPPHPPPALRARVRIRVCSVQLSPPALSLLQADRLPRRLRPTAGLPFLHPLPRRVAVCQGELAATAPHRLICPLHA